jgi:glutaminase
MGAGGTGIPGDDVMNHTLEELIRQCAPYVSEGHVATYIPQLANADPNAIGVCIVAEGRELGFAGEHRMRFTMQSVVKPIILLQALMDSGAERVRALVGVEATGKPFDAFNYSDQALTGAHINPMINTGAIALCTLIHGDTYEEKFARLLETTRKLAGNPHIAVDPDVYRSECETGNKNRALAYMLKAYGMVDDPADEILSCYFRACSILVDCHDLARIGYIFAHHGTDPETGAVYFSKAYAKYVNATLATCGMYDGSGGFALDVGFPAKSGVGGGIMGVIPNRMAIGVYAPSLDKHGNSVAGVQLLARLSELLNLSIY